jgi:glycosyltransferase involved in cell wall biosynthesis
MTVLFFCNLKTGKLGAFENLLLEIGRRLTVGGDRLVVIFGSPPFGPVPEALQGAGISWDYIPNWAEKAGHPRAWRFVLPALSVIRRYKPDLVAVHFGNEFPTLVTTLLCKCLMKRAPIWVWHQRQQIESPDLLTKRVSRIRLLSLAVDHFVVPYDGGRESLRARGVSPTSITRINNAVSEYVSLRPQGWLKQELHLSENAVVAVNVGWLVHRKRIDVTIRAFAKVAQTQPDAILLVVGEGPLRKELEALVSSCGLEERVRFLGARNDVRDILAQCDCLVHSSSAEACVNVVTEAMAAGIPAVIMDAGAAREQVIDGNSGYVVGVHDEGALGVRLEEVMRSRETRERMGAAARQRWHQLYNLEITAVEHCDLCRHLLARLHSSKISIKTLFFCNLISLKMGAFEKLLGAIAQEFRNGGDEFVVVFSGEPITPVAEFLRASGVRWQVLSKWAHGPGKERAWGYVLPALQLIRRERPDVAVVHFGNELPTLTAILLARLMGFWKIKWVWQQDQQIRDPGIIEKRLSRMRLLNSVANHFVAMYEGGRESMRKRGIPADKITVIHNAVAPFTPVRLKGWLRQEFGIGSDEVILVTIGSLIPRKRIDFLLRACAALGTEGKVVGCQDNPTTKLPPWRLFVIGEGSEREQLEAITRELGISDHVHFLGLRNDIREILPESDIYIHAALSEASTYSIAESMAAGIPAVVVDAGAAKEQIQDGVSGYVLGNADVEAFSSRVRELMEDVSKRTEMGRMAEARWRSKFTMDVSASVYHRLYRRLAGSA